MGCAVTFQGPNLHFTKSLTAKLSFPAEWLLGNQGVGTSRPGMHLIIHKVMQFQHINVTDRDFPIKRPTSLTVQQNNFSVLWETGFAKLLFDLLLTHSIESWARGVITKLACGESQMGFQDLSQIHTGSHAQGVENNIYWRSVIHKWHVFCGNNFGNHTLVAVPAGHLITN